MSVLVRTAVPADHDAVAGLPGLSGSTRRLLARDLAGVLPRHVLVASVRATVVGLGMTTRQPDEVHLLDLVVDRDHRRSGVATRLLAELAHRAMADDATAMTLEVRVSNDAALALYRSRGFVDDGVRPGYYHDGEDARILWHHDLPSLAAHGRGPRPVATPRSASGSVAGPMSRPMPRPMPGGR